MESHPLGFMALIFVIVTISSVMQAGLGMGFGLLAAPMLALIDPGLVPGPALMLATLAATLGALPDLRRIQPREVAIGITGRIIGIAAGGWLLMPIPDRRLFSLVFGLLILGGVVLLAGAGGFPSPASP